LDFVANLIVQHPLLLSTIHPSVADICCLFFHFSLFSLSLAIACLNLFLASWLNFCVILSNSTRACQRHYKSTEVNMLLKDIANTDYLQKAAQGVELQLESSIYVYCFITMLFCSVEKRGTRLFELFNIKSFNIFAYLIFFVVTIVAVVVYSSVFHIVNETISLLSSMRNLRAANTRTRQVLDTQS
jgi:hypothetical protein